MIKVSVVIATLNEEKNLPRCLHALSEFDDVVIVDSGSTDKTIEIARAHGACVHSFDWNGNYPKKRQWILENVKTKYNYIFFCDADEEVTNDFIDEIKSLKFSAVGYFVKGRYAWRGKSLKYGLRNNKLALLDKNKFEFPVIDDLGEFCMGEMEGHYQPVLKSQFKDEKIHQIQHSLNHFSYEDEEGWNARHGRYALWEAGMIRLSAYPKEDNKWREFLKVLFRKMPCRGSVAFVHSYIYKFGFLDGRAGFDFARSRYHYYKMVSAALKANR